MLHGLALVYVHKVASFAVNIAEKVEVNNELSTICQENYHFLLGNSPHSNSKMKE